MPYNDIPFARPFTGGEEEEAVIRVLRSGWLTTGAEALSFEKEFAEFLAADGLHCFAVNSATSGLHLALEACGIGQGDMVLVPSCTFTATAEVARYLGADPVFVDTAPGAFHMDPAALEQTVIRLPAEKAKAVIPVHYGGLCRDMGPIMDVARRYGLKVIEDAAHAFPSVVGNRLGTGDWAGGIAALGTGDRGLGTGDWGLGARGCDTNYRGMPREQYDNPNNNPRSPAPSPRSPSQSPVFAGTIGDAGVFSFYATKTITTGEGGMLVCRDEAMAKRISLMRCHGIDRAVWNRYTDMRAPWYYEVIEAGYKYNMPDILAAIGRVQLERAWGLLRMREEIAASYDAVFAGNERLLLPPTGPGDARHLYPLRLNPRRLRITRDDFIGKLGEAGIGVSMHFIPLHTMPFYKNRYQLAEDAFPETVKSCGQEISLPIWPGMSGEQISRVIDAVQSICNTFAV
ncbi:MAG: DegT/DnrJ/EryC1/StrS aminotransferase family protein [Treponema sp.]|nr:DegT/DnrJ/EryC1/StrS aminotransferase family protein [Treponema sp.]